MCAMAVVVGRSERTWRLRLRFLDEEAQGPNETEICRVAITKAEPESRDSKSGDNENCFLCYFMLNQWKRCQA